MNHNHLDNLPKVIVFNSLHVIKSLRAIIKALTGIAGIYAIVNTVTGQVYIGSSVSVGIRLTSHLIRRNTNGHLQSAIALKGLEVFQVVLVEIYELDPNLSDVENIVALLEREQHWLNWLFSLPEQFRYNFASVAEASFKGLTHTPETKAQMSSAHTGKTPSTETRAKMSEAHKGLKSGANNPMFGITPTNAMTINVYDLDNVLVHSFSSQIAAANWLNTSPRTVSRYIEPGKVWNKLYTFRNSS